MARQRWVSDIAANGKVAALILKNSIENEKLLSTMMNMRREFASRTIADDGGSASHLFANPVEHYPVDAGHWRRFPAFY
jgi:hypothetical protein